MKSLAPVFVVLIILMAFLSAVTAQTRIHNPELPKSLVFQWRIEAEVVHPSWSNADFSISRSGNSMVIFYGVFGSFESALAEMPELPAGVSKDQVSLIPFFNQHSINAMDAFALMGGLGRNVADNPEDREVVSFTVYFGTYESIQESFTEIDQPLSFKVLPGYLIEYSAGEFANLEEAEACRSRLTQAGYEFAEVNKYLNGQHVAMLDEQQLYAFAQWSKR